MLPIARAVPATRAVAPPDSRRPVGCFITPVSVTDKDGRETANFRLPRKLGKALVSGELVALAGDTIIAEKVRVVP
jgi:hypothetical protein